jgi:hypothetical protein
MIDTRLTVATTVMKFAFIGSPMPQAPAPSSSAAWGGGRRGVVSECPIDPQYSGIHSQHASSSWSAPHWAAWVQCRAIASWLRLSVHHSHSSTNSGGGVIGLVFIIIKLMQSVIKKRAAVAATAQIMRKCGQNAGSSSWCSARQEFKPLDA